jgi:hypothetical protein
LARGALQLSKKIQIKLSTPDCEKIVSGIANADYTILLQVCYAQQGDIGGVDSYFYGCKNKQVHYYALAL